ncbi:MAG: TRAP transporter large permease, partial [Parasporobacterium sp.]|nr:TRAP transporter large permease [Parasporobacterium sp.]
MNTGLFVILLFVLFFLLLFASTPIGVSLGITCLVAILFFPNKPFSPAFFYQSMVAGFDTFTLLAIPLFVLSGIIMARGGISKRLFNFFGFFLGGIPGGLPMCVVVTCLFYGAISGSAPATTAAVGAMAIPILLEAGYDKKFTVALVAIAGGLGVIIPPSVPFILYSQSANVSTGDMFLAGIIPGLLIALGLCAYCFVYCKIEAKKNGVGSSFTAFYREMHKNGFWKGLWDVFKKGFFALLCPVIILGGIYGGIMTPTEAAAISVIYAAIVSAFIYKTLDLKGMIDCVKESIGSIAPAMLVLGCASIFARVLAMTQVPKLLTDLVLGFTDSRFVVLLIINVILLIAGMFIDSIAAILIFTPILLPLAQAVGVDG